MFFSLFWAAANTVTVSDPALLQAEIDALQDVVGHHDVLLTPGLEYPPVVVAPAAGVTLSLGPVDPLEPVDLTGTGSNGAVWVSGEGSVRIRDVRIRPEDGARALRVSGTATLIVKRVVVEGGTYAVSNGGAVHAGAGSNLIVRQTVFEGASTALSGGAIAFVSTGDLTVDDSRFQFNRATNGGAIFTNAGHTVIRSTVFADNEASAVGGGAYLGGTSWVSGGQFLRNLAGSNGGGLGTAGGSHALADSSFQQNAAGVHGGAVYHLNGAVQTDRIVAEANTAVFDGAGIFSHNTVADVRDSSFCHNVSDRGGAVTYWQVAGGSVTDSLFLGNASGSFGGAIHAYGAIDLEHLTFASNTSAGANQAVTGAGSIHRSLFLGHAGPATVLPTFQSVGALGEVLPTAALYDLGFAPSVCSVEAFQLPCSSPAAQQVVSPGHLVGAAVECLETDADGDGVAQPLDCDDTDPTVSPNAVEWCGNAVDEDCDGVAVQGWLDADGDSFGALRAWGYCDPALVVAEGGDCDDGYAFTYPGAVEACDGSDNSCDGVLLADEEDVDGDGFICSDDCGPTHPGVYPGAPEVCDTLDNDCDPATPDGDLGTGYADVDGDGYGEGGLIAACPGPAISSVGGDCQPSDPNTHPNALEFCNALDDDCDGEVDEGPSADGTVQGFRDDDGDGFGVLPAVALCSLPQVGYASRAGDCDDANAETYPFAVEACDGVDRDCSGTVDDAVWFADEDGDLFGDAATRTVQCPGPIGWVERGRDCDDSTASRSPGSLEICNGVDDDCDGRTDEDLPTISFYADADGDGYGWSLVSVSACADAPPAGFVADATDCLDTDRWVHPGGIEICNSLDDDCDLSTDESGTVVPRYPDGDGDGYGDGVAVNDCLFRLGYAPADGDCDDADPTVHPSAMEVCDTVDNDCDGTLDPSPTADYFPDLDFDGFGDVFEAIQACVQPVGLLRNDGDCDDTDAAVNNQSPEICDGLDNDCNGVVDDLPGSMVFYADDDGDGFGDPDAPVPSCAGQPAGTVLDASDCDDGDATIFPMAAEACDSVDTDCDGHLDNGFSTATWFRDADGDGLGGLDELVQACAALGPVGFVGNEDDCDDTDAAVQLAPATYQDLDLDGFGGALASFFRCQEEPGFSHNADDCDDSNAARSPGLLELCDGIDNNCDGQGLIDEAPLAAGEGDPYFVDLDGDGYGVDGTAVVSCGPELGRAPLGGDCDDDAITTNPGSPEQCDDEVDNNCNEVVDLDAVSVDWFADGDGDGWGSGIPVANACSQPEPTAVPRAGDCEDGEASINPGVIEQCDPGVDFDCDGHFTAGAVDGFVYYLDQDGDGVGAGPSFRSCVVPLGYALNTGDCADKDASRSPTQVEICDGLDNDCNLVVDDSALSGLQTFFIDEDGDGWGAAEQTACTRGELAVEQGGDCDDLDATVHPDRPERCNSEDDDCDGIVDESDGLVAAGEVYYLDNDLDGFGDPEVTLRACQQPSGYVGNPDDCNDAALLVSPLAEERCDGVDDDCDGQIDEDAVVGTTTVYLDEDGDGDPTSTPVEVCDPAMGSAAPGRDCDDADPTVSTLLPEVCDDLGTRDEDCDALANAADPDCTLVVVAPPPPSGCGCETSGAPSMGWMLGLLWLVPRRRAS